MFRKFLGVLALFLVIAVPLDDAEARRRGIPIPIPGLRGETLVLVQELPRIPLLQRKDGTYIDLGYKFNSFSGGEWVGYVGSDSEYLTIAEPQLKLILLLAGMTDFPAVPDRPWSWGGIFWLVVGGIAVISILSKKLRGPGQATGTAAPSAGPDVSQPAAAAHEPGTAAAGASYSRAGAGSAIPAAAPRRPGMIATAASLQSAGFVSGRQMGGAKVAQTSFGRRK